MVVGCYIRLRFIFNVRREMLEAFEQQYAILSSKLDEHLLVNDTIDDN